jgi:hypothetical protein
VMQQQQQRPLSWQWRMLQLRHSRS